MIEPQIPVDDADRVAALAALQILDTPPEERFDRLTRLATQVFSVPIALVSLVDTDRQWFKSCVGIDGRETDRSISFCGHAINEPTTFVVEDASLDARFSDNPLVTGEPFVRFYAGHPLTTVEGHRIGMFCIIDRVPRLFDHEQRGILREHECRDHVWVPPPARTEPGDGAAARGGGVGACRRRIGGRRHRGDRSARAHHVRQWCRPNTLR